MFESLKRKHFSFDDYRVKDKIYFILKFENERSYIELRDSKGKKVDTDAVIATNEYDNSILQKINEIKEKDEFNINWDDEIENKSERLYLDNNSFLVDYLLKSESFINENKMKIELAEEEINLELIIEKVEEKFKAKINFNNNLDYKIISQTHLYSNGKIYLIKNIGDNYQQLKEFEVEIKDGYLNKFLSIFYSYFTNIKCQVEGFSIKKINSISLKPVIVFEKIDVDKYLHLKIGLNLDNYDFEFFKEFNIKKVVDINEKSKDIYIREVDYNKSVQAFDDLFKMLKKSKDKSEFFIDNDYIIMSNNFAKEFLQKKLHYLINHFELYGSEKLNEYKIKISKPKLTFGLSSSIDYFEGDMEINIEDETFSVVNFLKMYNKDKYIKLTDNSNVIIEKKFVDKLNRIFDEKKGEFNVSFYDLPVIEEMIETQQLKTVFSKEIEVYEGFNEIEKVDLNLKEVDAELRNYQEYGTKWLKYLYENRLGGCLADDMGLGKTLQAIALIKNIYTDKKKIVIVVPTSLIYNWENELKKFTPDLEYAIYYGNNRDFKVFEENKIFITTYGVLRNDIGRIKDIEFDTAILDESQNIKNINSQISKAVLLIKAENRFALSGTPIENHLGELFSLFRFLNPKMFGTVNNFNKKYIVPIQKEGNEDVSKELKKKIYPFILRRKKRDVLKELPEKVEQTLYVDMNTKQKKLYNERRIFFKEVLDKQIEREGVKKSQFFIFQALNELRRITSNPESFSENRITSSKRDLLMENLQDIVSNGRKALVFTNFLNVIEKIEEDLTKEGIKYLVITGATKKRQEIVNLFQNEEEYKVLIMTLKTGGVGLNLTAADSVFIFDPWWNVSAEQQAIDRAHRIGQDKTVFSYKIITKDSIEEKIELLQKKKRELIENIIEEDTMMSKSISESDLEYILGE
ncbi:DEAD/DEAH box helicase [Haliovirga abyssi]|uniref:Helicase SNF n=1 Tax=Haliovirga abyssi TaxID=2996794 RepID=A0AAU9DFZ3_9FUSO|nr:DEAD/DEAH box helicase [Haliovirga abyssi]BDU51377.1 helicase SNF [Haliovirga abyssi]